MRPALGIFCLVLSIQGVLVAQQTDRLPQPLRIAPPVPVVPPATALNQKTLNLPNRTTFIQRLRFVSAEKAAEKINQLLQDKHQLQPSNRGVVSESPVVIVPVLKSNSLIISAQPRWAEEIRKLLKTLDAMPKQHLVKLVISTTDENGKMQVISRPTVLSRAGQSATIEISRGAGKSLRVELVVHDVGPPKTESLKNPETHAIEDSAQEEESNRPQVYQDLEDGYSIFSDLQAERDPADPTDGFAPLWNDLEIATKALHAQPWQKLFSVIETTQPSLGERLFLEESHAEYGLSASDKSETQAEFQLLDIHFGDSISSHFSSDQLVSEINDANVPILSFATPSIDLITRKFAQDSSSLKSNKRRLQSLVEKVREEFSYISGLEVTARVGDLSCRQSCGQKVCSQSCGSGCVAEEKKRTFQKTLALGFSLPKSFQKNHLQVVFEKGEDDFQLFGALTEKQESQCQGTTLARLPIVLTIGVPTEYIIQIWLERQELENDTPPLPASGDLQKVEEELTNQVMTFLKDNLLELSLHLETNVLVTPKPLYFEVLKAQKGESQSF